MIVVEDLGKNYGNKIAVGGVSFCIDENEIVGILGLNGAGKSTILKMLGTFLLPSSGSATVAGYSVADNPDEVRRNIGYLPDTPPLYNEMDVTSFLRFVAQLKDVASVDVDSFVQEAIGQTDLGSVCNIRLGSLSHGFRQRVGIASSLVHKPRVLILDEPINGLDPVQIVGMRDLIVSLKENHTVILSSHILSEITRTCDRILIIDKGRLVAEGTERELSDGKKEVMRVTCEVSSLTSGMVDALRKIKGVQTVEPDDALGDSRHLVIEATRDVRSTVSDAIVKSGAGLLGLSAEGVGLETVFMKMVGKSEKNKNKNKQLTN